ncbi:MAG: capsular biosynthesis protein, partial [Sphingobacteriaceae bacterium]
MNQVVNELKLYAPVYSEARWKDVPAYATSPVKVELQNPDSLIETKRINFTYDVISKKVKLNGKVFTLNQWINTSSGKLRFVLNNKNYQGQSSLYFSLVNPKGVVQSLSGELAISSSGKLSSVVNLKFRDAVPKRSEDILNTLIAVYDRASVNDKNALAANTISFLDERLKNVGNDLETIEKKMQQYRANKGAIDISSQGKLFLENVSTNDQKLSDVNMKLSVLSQVAQNLLSKDVRGGVTPSTLGIDDPVLTNLLTKLYDAKSQYEKLRRTTGENNPELTSLTDQIDRLNPIILDNIRSQQRSLQASKSNLYSTNTSYNSTLSRLPQQERDLVEISREQNSKSSIYSFLLQKKEEAALSHSATVSDTRVVDKAESSIDPVGQSNKIVYIISVILAVGFGVLFISARESLSGTVLFRQEIE